MAEENYTTKFRVDISDLKKGITDANKTIKTANAEFKNASAGMDDWTKSADGLTAKIKQQETVVDAEKQKLNLLKQQLDRLNQSQQDGEAIIADLTAKHNDAVETYGASSEEAKKYAKQLLDAQKAQERNAKAAEDLNIKILNQDTAVKKAEKELDGYHSALDELTSSTDYLTDRQNELTEEYKKAVKEYGRNSDEAKELKSQLKDVSGQMKEAEKASKDLGDAAEDSGDGFTVARGAIADFIGNGLSKLASSIGNAISNVASLADETREYRTIMGSLTNSSERAGYSTEETANTFKQLNGVLGDTQSAATTTANLQAIGLEQGKLEDLTNSVIGAWATYGDSIPIDGLAEAVNETIKVGQVTGTFADTLNWAKMSNEDYQSALGGNKDALDAFNKAVADGENMEDAFSAALAACSSETARADLVTQTFTKMGLGEAGKAWQENNKSIVDANNAQAKYENATAQLGQTIEPITTKIREGFGAIVGKIVELVQKADFSGVAQAIDAGFSFMINTVLPAISSGFTWIIEHKDGILAALAGIAAAFLAFKAVTIIQGIITAFTTLIGVIKSVGIAQAALNLIMSLNPIGLVVAAIAALIAIFAVLWNKCDGFREFWINLWENIKKVAGAVWEAISGFFSAAWDKIKSIWEPVVDYFKAKWDNIKLIFSVVKKVLSGFFSDAWNAIKKVWNGVKNFFSGVWNSIKSIFSNPLGFFKEKFTAAWNGIKSVFSGVGEFFGGIWNTIKEKFTNIGTKIGDAVGGAFKAVINFVLQSVENVINTPIRAINGLIGIINKIPNVNIGKLNEFSLPRLAHGGIVSKPTLAEIGENGEEAVIPLERNKGGLKKIASMLSSELKSSGTKTGTTAGETVYNFNQTNNSPKPLSRYEIYRQTKNLINAAKGV